MIAFLLLAADAEGQVAQIARTFGVDWPHLGAQIISFGIVCALLYKFAYQNILAMLEERRRQIAQGIANAERIKAELSRTEAQRQEVLEQAHAQAAIFIEQARTAAARVLDEETRKAMLIAEQITIRAKQTAVQDYEWMLGELKHEVGRLVMQATTVVTGRVLTTDDQRRLVEETAKQVAAAAA
jgi:F-type H+-transporting ATPase subunit b